MLFSMSSVKNFVEIVRHTARSKRLGISGSQGEGDMLSALKNIQTTINGFSLTTENGGDVDSLVSLVLITV